MANGESTGFRKLIGALTQRPVDRDSADEMLFTDPDAAPRRVRTARAFEVILPRSLEDAVTLRVRREPERLELAKLALPFGLLAVLGVLIGLAIARPGTRDEAPAASAAEEAAAPKPAATPPAPPPPPTP